MKNTKEYIKVKDEFLSKEVFSLAIDEAAEMLLTLPSPNKIGLRFTTTLLIIFLTQTKQKACFLKYIFFPEK